MLANWYIEKRTENPSTPASWTKYGPEIEADAYDLAAFQGAIFFKNGIDVLLRDGSSMRKILSRKTPWKECDGGFPE